MTLKKRKRIVKKGNRKTKVKLPPKTKWLMRLLDSYLAMPSQKSQRGCSDLQGLSKPLSNVQEFPKKEKEPTTTCRTSALQKILLMGRDSMVG